MGTHGSQGQAATTMRIPFLDLDGVLNDGRYDPETATFALVPGCVERLSRIGERESVGTRVRSGQGSIHL